LGQANGLGRKKSRRRGTAPDGTAPLNGIKKGEGGNPGGEKGQVTSVAFPASRPCGEREGKKGEGNHLRFASLTRKKLDWGKAERKKEKEKKGRNDFNTTVFPPISVIHVVSEQFEGKEVPGIHGPRRKHPSTIERKWGGGSREGREGNGSL